MKIILAILICLLLAQQVVGLHLHIHADEDNNSTNSTNQTSNQTNSSNETNNETSSSNETNNETSSSNETSNQTSPSHLTHLQEDNNQTSNSTNEASNSSNSTNSSTGSDLNTFEGLSTQGLDADTLQLIESARENYNITIHSNDPAIVEAANDTEHEFRAAVAAFKDRVANIDQTADDAESLFDEAVKELKEFGAALNRKLAALRDQVEGQSNFSGNSTSTNSTSSNETSTQ